MSEPTPILKQAHARAELLRLRLRELRGHAVASRSVSKASLIAHLDEDERQLGLLIDEIRQGFGGAEE